MARAKTVQFPQALSPADKANFAVSRIPFLVVTTAAYTVVIPNEDQVIFLNLAGVITVTLPLPVAGGPGGQGTYGGQGQSGGIGGDDGTKLTFIAVTAQAHVVNTTSGTGFNGATNNTATFAAALTNGLQIIAWNGRWWSYPNINQGITFSAT